MYKANGEYIKSHNLYETFTDITTPPTTSVIATVGSNTQIQQVDNIGDVRITGNNKAVGTVVDNAVSSIVNMPQMSYQSQRQQLQVLINDLKKISKDDVFKNKNNIITMLKSAVDDKIGKISNMNKNDTYKLFRNLISILQETDYMLNDLERVTPRLQKLMNLLGNTRKTIY